MARIVLTSFGSFGDVNPYIGLGLALKARGHVPVLAMPQVYRDMVEAEGLEFRGVRPDLPVDDHALTRRIMDPNRGTEVLFTECSRSKKDIFISPGSLLLNKTMLLNISLLFLLANKINKKNFEESMKYGKRYVG